MGRRNFTRDKFLKEHPLCCYCGGIAAATTVDHVPSTQFFKHRIAPFVLRVPACKPCNHPLGPSEQVVAFLARLSPHVPCDQESAEILHNFIRANPDLAYEIVPRGSNRRKAERRFGQNISFDLSSPLIHRHVQAVGAKWGYALHYSQLGKAVPSKGGAFVHWWTNAHRINGPILPESLEALLPSEAKALRQGNHTSIGQFEFATTVMPDRSGILTFLSCSFSFAMLLWTVEDIAVFDPHRFHGLHIHRPGTFLSYPIPLTSGWYRFRVA